MPLSPSSGISPSGTSRSVARRRPVHAGGGGAPRSARGEGSARRRSSGAITSARAVAISSGPRVTCASSVAFSLSYVSHASRSVGKRSSVAPVAPGGAYVRPHQRVRAVRDGRARVPPA
ncbi:hypothetical protein BE21_52830 [Sorangium cellulosum]|uniref:Uncharacterized protein n=1 Tax=Sorangium cellulosum TaxID=56 RepID=A0A150TEV8_SORCE|nr:hypothetical protein BE21_52830 [Sorangium cellulosum]